MCQNAVLCGNGLRVTCKPQAIERTYIKDFDLQYSQMLFTLYQTIAYYSDLSFQQYCGKWRSGRFSPFVTKISPFVYLYRKTP